MRELTTIGSLDIRATRAIARARRRAPLTMGALGSAQLDAAVAVNNALSAHGYVLADMPLYQAFAQAQGIPADDAQGNVYPGTKFMTQLQAVLLDGGVTPANVPTYPWLASGGYDGVNAPTSAQWYGTSSSSGSGSVLVLPTETIVGKATPANLWWWVLGLGAAGLGTYALARMMRKGKRRKGQRAKALLLLPA